MLIPGGDGAMVARSLHRHFGRCPLLPLLAAVATTMGVLTPSTAMAATSKIGRTWPIAEPDALSEIEGRAAHVPDMKSAFGPRENWSAMKAATLGIAQADRNRTVVPLYTLEQDIRLPDGKLLYARGYSFNPLAYVSLPQRLIVVGRALFLLEERVKVRLGLKVAPAIVAQTGQKLVLTEVDRRKTDRRAAR